MLRFVAFAKDTESNNVKQIAAHKSIDFFIFSFLHLLLTPLSYKSAYGKCIQKIYTQQAAKQPTGCSSASRYPLRTSLCTSAFTNHLPNQIPIAMAGWHPSCTLAFEILKLRFAATFTTYTFSGQASYLSNLIFHTL